MIKILKVKLTLLTLVVRYVRSFYICVFLTEYFYRYSLASVRRNVE